MLKQLAPHRQTIPTMAKVSCLVCRKEFPAGHEALKAHLISKAASCLQDGRILQDSAWSRVDKDELIEAKRWANQKWMKHAEQPRRTKPFQG